LWLIDRKTRWKDRQQRAFHKNTKEREHAKLFQPQAFASEKFHPQVKNN
jgi:hypothetical protein